MVSATEAQKRTHRTYMDRIEILINAASYNGKAQISIDGLLPEEVKHELIKNGYKIREKYFLGTSTQISWE